MHKNLIKTLGLAFGLILPVMALAQTYDYNYDSDYYSDYNYDYYNDSYDTSTSAGGVALGIGVMIFIGIMVLVGLVLLIFTIWMIVDAAKRDFDQKVMWILLMVFFGWIAAIIYYFMVKRKNITRASPKGSATPTAPSA